MRDIITGNFAPSRWMFLAPRSLRIIDWNVDRGLRLQGIIDFLASTNADLFVLQEVDLNARRTRRLNIAEEIARSLKLNYVFGREFQELVQGSKDSPAYHGQAILAKWPISNPRLILFSRQSHFWQPHWFLPRTEPFQERLGGRIALVAEINVAGNKLVIYNLHLESRSNDQLRISQLEEVLADASCRGPQCPVVIAGDLNLDVSKSSAALAFSRAGFQEALAGLNTPTTPPHGWFGAGRPIDWAFVRGPMRPGSGRVHNRVRASDHYPLSFSLTRGNE